MVERAVSFSTDGWEDSKTSLISSVQRCGLTKNGSIEMVLAQFLIYLWKVFGFIDFFLKIWAEINPILVFSGFAEIQSV